jgi:hypothetical protein
MAKKINLDTDNPTLKELLAHSEEWAHQNAKDLSPDQLAVLNLKSLIDAKALAPHAFQAKDCFICGTAA